MGLSTSNDKNFIIAYVVVIYSVTLTGFKAFMIRDFLGGLVAKTPWSQCRGPGSIPHLGTRSHMPLLAATQAWCSRLNTHTLKNKTFMIILFKSNGIYS